MRRSIASWPIAAIIAPALLSMLVASAAEAQAGAKPKTSVNQKPSALVQLFASVDEGEMSATLEGIDGDGNHSAFSIPSGTVLVVTDVVVRSTPLQVAPLGYFAKDK